LIPGKGVRSNVFSCWGNQEIVPGTFSHAEKIAAIATDISEFCQRYWPVITAVFAAAYG
jgi:hypothetical protein